MSRAPGPAGVRRFLVGYVLVSLAALVLRTLRYWVLLERRAPLGPLALITLVRNLFVDLVPVRAGAAASYLYLVTARLGLPMEAAGASFALSFILDTLALAPLLVLAVLAVGAPPVSPLWLIGGSLVLAGSAAALFLGLGLLALLCYHGAVDPSTGVSLSLRPGALVRRGYPDLLPASADVAPPESGYPVVVTRVGVCVEGGAGE